MQSTYTFNANFPFSFDILLLTVMFETYPFLLKNFKKEFIVIITAGLKAHSKN